MNSNDKFKKNKLRILIADDVQETRRNTRLMLSEIEYVEVVAIASNGKQAVEMTEEQRPDIVVLDINMPEMDGLTAFKHIVQMFPGTGCIFISGEKDEVTVQKAAAIGANAFLAKPFTIEEIEASIKNVVENIHIKRQKIAQSNQVNVKTVSLEELANEYLKEGRTDSQSTQLFERLAQNPNCDIRWLEALGMIYAVQGEWSKLKVLAERIEKVKK
jgi:YesN/AraC family two-component response regulator